MIIGFPETEDCMRCDGKGYYFLRLGYPGQDPRDSGGYAAIEWQPATGPHWCQACNETGQKEMRSPKQTEPRYLRIHTDGTRTNEKEQGYGN